MRVTEVKSDFFLNFYCRIRSQMSKIGCARRVRPFWHLWPYPTVKVKKNLDSKTRLLRWSLELNFENLMSSPFKEGGVDQEWPFSPKYFFLAGWGEGLRSNSKWGEKGIWVKRGGKARKPNIKYCRDRLSVFLSRWHNIPRLLTLLYKWVSQWVNDGKGDI